ncbi:MAG: ABC transporter permease [Promethearchaeota archaeon]
MSLDFVLKDIYRKKRYSLGFIRAQSSIITFFLFFTSLSSSLGFVTLGSSLNLFTSSVVSVYRQFSDLATIMLMVACAVVTFSVSWTLVSNKMRDIGIMKAVGALPNRLYSFYLLELLVLSLLSFALGVVLASVSVIVVVGVLAGLGLRVTLAFSVGWTLGALAAVLLTSFVTGTVLLRVVGKKTVTETFSSDVPYKTGYPNYFSPVPRLLMKLGFTVKVAVRNLVRRVRDFHRQFLYLGVILSVVLTLGLGLLTVGRTNEQYFHNAQGDGLLVIGHEDLVRDYQNMYDTFRGVAPFPYEDRNYSDSRFWFNGTILGGALAAESGVEGVEPRILYRTSVLERSAVTAHVNTEVGAGNQTVYEVVGKARSMNVSIVGVDPNSSISHARRVGNLPARDDPLNASIGDTLASELFDSPLLQSVFVKDLQVEYNVVGIVIDSFSQGKALYVGIDELRDQLGREPGEVNLLLATPSTNLSAHELASLREVVRSMLGENFTVISLERTFNDNLAALRVVELTYLTLIAVLILIGSYSIYEYQKASLETKMRDFAIMKALGASRGRVLRILFIEGLFIVLPSVFLALGVSMLFTQFFLITDATLPSIAVPLGLFGVVALSLLLLDTFALIRLRGRLDPPATILKQIV